MNPETNKFEILDRIVEEDNKRIEKEFGMLLRTNGKPIPKHWSIFKVNENYIINNYTFKCKYIGETSILFEPVGIVEVGNETK